MHIQKLGQSDLYASVLSLGTWAQGGDSSWGYSQDELSIHTIHTALESGVNLVDTAPVYGLGHSEEVVGKALHGCRDRFLIASKCGLVWDQEEGYVHLTRDGAVLRRELSAKSLRKQLEQSLTRLNTDYIDLYITHWQSLPPNQTSIAETMETLNHFLQEGKIRAIGISNVTSAQIEEYASHGPIAVVQQKFSILDRLCEQEIIPKCKKLGITFQAYSPLERGILTGNVTMDTPVVGTAKQGIKWYEPSLRKKIITALEQFQPLCQKYQVSMSSLIIAWTAQSHPNINVLCGARKPEHLLNNIAGGNCKLSPEDFIFMDTVMQNLS